MQAACHRQSACVFPVLQEDVLFSVDTFFCRSSRDYDFYLEVLYDCLETGKTYVT